MANSPKCLSQLFEAHFNIPADKIEELPQSGSYRQYYRITSAKYKTLGVYNTDLQENKAYLSFTETFRKAKISVPEIYSVSDDKVSYLVQDLGKTSLWNLASEDMKRLGCLSKNTKVLYQKTLKELLKIQTQTIKQLDLSYCYPRDTFDKQSMLWDLNYFKYFFLRLMRIGVNEQKLEDDIQRLSSDLDKVDNQYFLYRDFQSRNVIITKNKPYFIDFQGGRKGAIFYDIASLLYDANVELIKKDREELLAYYYNAWNDINDADKNEFYINFNTFAIIRLTQALGAFGLRGVVEQKPHFKECIPFALEALCEIFKNNTLSTAYPEISTAIKLANESHYIKEIVKM